MTKRYSIAEARDNLAAIVHELEKVQSIEITRRGQPVAILLSKEEYDRMLSRKNNFWDAYQSFLQRADDSAESDIDTEEIFGVLRDKSPGREIDL